MIRMLLVGYCFGIRSERRLCGGSPSQPGLPLVLPAGASTAKCRTIRPFSKNRHGRFRDSDLLGGRCLRP